MSAAGLLLGGHCGPILAAEPQPPASIVTPAAGLVARLETSTGSLPLSLEQAREIALQGNRTIRVAVRNVDVASSEVRRVDVSPNPNFIAQISNTESNRYRMGSSDRLFRLEQLIERGGKRELRRATAEQLELASRNDLQDVRRQQSAQVGAIYFDLVSAQALALIAQDNVAGYERLLDAARKRLAAGDLAVVDVSRLNVEAQRAFNDLRNAMAAASQARVGLAATLGLEGRSADILASDELSDLARIEATTNAILADAPIRINAAMDSRADVRSAQTRIAALDRARELARSLRTRDVTLGLQAERIPSAGGSVLGISASVPLFINNDYGGEIGRAQADLDVAREDLERIRAIVRSDSQRALVQLQTASDRARRLLRDALPESQRVARAIEFAFSRGAATLTDLFDARRQLAALRTEVIQAQSEFDKAVVAWQASISTETPP